MRATEPAVTLGCMTLQRGKRRLTVLAFVLMLGVAAGCGGDDDEATENKRQPKVVDGTFVGKVAGTKALVAVVAAPAAKGNSRRDVTVFACDAKSICEWLSGSVTGNSFTAADGEVKATGKLSDKAATGTIRLPGRSAKFTTSAAAATSGLYTLTVAPNGKLTGSSAAGVGLTGKSTLPSPGRGRLKLADGTRLKFVASKSSSRNALRVPAGEARVIVLEGRQLSGAGKSRGKGASGFMMRSASG
jgi:hypothetical protein